MSRADQAIVGLALSRGFLTPAQLEEASRLAGAQSVLPVLAARYLTSAQVAELKVAYQRVQGSGAWGALGADSAATVIQPQGIDSAATVIQPQGIDSAATVIQPQGSDSAATVIQPQGSDLADSTATVVHPSGRAPAVAPAAAAGGAERIGPYEVVRELARGGMGVVYVARRPGLDREVALKVLLPGSTSVDMVQRFQIEANVAARLRHPHIVGIHDVGQDAGQHYLTMDLIQGESLHARLERDGPLPPREAAGLCAKLADALAYAHRRAVLHRDIKPHNVLLDEAGEPLLTDFGLAKDVDQEEHGLTKTGQVMGTPAYMPPEQADGDLDRVGRRSDVYSLGATLYCMLVGRPPFQGKSSMQLLKAVLLDEPTPPRTLVGAVPADLNTICLTCLEKEAEARYPSAQALREDLERFLAGRPIEASPPGTLDRLAKWTRRNRAVTLVAAAAALLLVAGLGVAGLQVARADAAALEAMIVRTRSDAETAWEVYTQAATLAADVEALPRDERAARLEPELRLAREAFMAAQRFDAVDRGPAARQALVRAGVAVGRCAARAGLWADAELTYARLEKLGLTASELEAPRAELRAERERARQAETAEVRGLIDEVRRGVRTPQDAAFGVLKFPTPATVQLLCAELDQASEVLDATAREFYLGLAEPTAAEVAVGQELLDMEPVLQRWLAQALFPGEEDEAVLRLAEARHRGRRGGEVTGRVELALSQRLALGPGAEVVDLALLCLGQLRDGEAVPALRRYAVLVADNQRAGEALRLLCELDTEEGAYRFAQASRAHHGPIPARVADAFARAHPGAKLSLEHGEQGRVGALLAKAQRALAEWRNEDATQPLEELLVNHPQHALGRALYGVLFLRLDRLDAAVGEIDHALRLDPQLAFGLAARARCRIQRGDFTGARRSLQRALEVDARSIDVHAVFGALEVAQENYRAGQLHFERALALDPRHVETLQLAAENLNRLDRFAEAKVLLDRALEVVELGPLLVERVQVQLSLGENAGASRDLERLKVVDPSHPEMQALRGGLAMRKGRYREALGCYTRLITLRPGEARAYFARAAAHEKLGDPRAVLRDLERCLELDPEHIPALHQRAGARLTLGEDPANAVRDLDRALELDPDFSVARLRRAQLRGQVLHDLPGALADSKELVRRDPDDYEHWGQLVEANFALRQFEQAVGACQQGLAHNPAWYLLELYQGKALLHALGRKEAGRAALKRYLESAPADDPYREAAEGWLRE